MRTMIVMIIIIFLAPFVHAEPKAYNGMYKEYYPNGVLRSQKQLKNGKNEGVSMDYHSNGKLAFSQIVRGGKINGPAKAFYESGSLKGEVKFVDNLEQGVLREYHENGRIKEEGLYVDGTLLRLKTFDENGNLVSIQEGHFPPGCRVIYSQKANII